MAVKTSPNTPSKCQGYDWHHITIIFILTITIIIIIILTITITIITIIINRVVVKPW